MKRDARIEQTLNEIVRRLVAEYQPEKIILFGSYAYGEPNEDSDLDMLVIKETTERLRDRRNAVRRTISGAHPHIPLDVLVLTPNEVAQRIRIGDQFLIEILENGEVLHAA